MEEAMMGQRTKSEFIFASGYDTYTPVTLQVILEICRVF
jgi:hypothetical protein